MITSTRRKALEDYAQNVLRANKCKAKHMQWNQVVFAVVFGALALITVLNVCRIGSVVQDSGFLLAGALVFMVYSLLQRRRYWRHVEETIQTRLDQIMDELRKPGEPQRGPGDFAISIVDSIFDDSKGLPGLYWAFKREPELVFPSPSSDLV